MAADTHVDATIDHVVDGEEQPVADDANTLADRNTFFSKRTWNLESANPIQSDSARGTKRLFAHSPVCSTVTCADGSNSTLARRLKPRGPSAYKPHSRGANHPNTAPSQQNNRDLLPANPLDSSGTGHRHDSRR